jgi:hypothetical protein
MPGTLAWVGGARRVGRPAAPRRRSWPQWTPRSVSTEWRLIATDGPTPPQAREDGAREANSAPSRRPPCASTPTLGADVAARPVTPQGTLSGGLPICGSMASATWRDDGRLVPRGPQGTHGSSRPHDSEGKRWSTNTRRPTATNSSLNACPHECRHRRNHARDVEPASLRGRTCHRFGISYSLGAPRRTRGAGFGAQCGGHPSSSTRLATSGSSPACRCHVVEETGCPLGCS